MLLKRGKLGQVGVAGAGHGAVVKVLCWLLAVPVLRCSQDAGQGVEMSHAI